VISLLAQTHGLVKLNHFLPLVPFLEGFLRDPSCWWFPPLRGWQQPAWLSDEITIQSGSNFLSLWFRNTVFTKLDLTSPAVKLLWSEGMLGHPLTIPLWKLSSQTYYSVWGTYWLGKQLSSSCNSIGNVVWSLN